MTERLDGPWWESELPAIRHELAHYLNRRLPAWIADHDDLLNDTLLSLTRELRVHSSAYPNSWFEAVPPSNDDDRLYLRRLTTVILKRRIADLFRKRTPQAEVLVTGESPLEVADSKQPSAERRILLARLLQVTNDVLATMTPADRDLIALIATNDRLRGSLDARERQRLHRLRSTLRNEIVRRLGNDVNDLLRDTD